MRWRRRHSFTKLGLLRAVRRAAGGIGRVRACRCAQTWNSVGTADRSVRRWVTPITVSAALVALTTAFLWMIDAPLQHDHLIFIYLVPTALIAIRYGSISAMCVTIASSIRRGLFPVRAALQLPGGEPARPAGTHAVQPAGAARKPGGFRLCQRQRCREAAQAGARRPAPALARAMAVDGGAVGSASAADCADRDQNVW